MRAFKAFLRKELTAQKRTGKLYILAAVALLLGIMAPASAKLMPKLLESIGTEGYGITVTMTETTAFSSFQQFFKNASMMLIAFFAVEMGIFTGEYRSGTLVLALTKGLSRGKVLAAKTIVLISVWTVCWLVSFGITCGYTAALWSMDTVNDLAFAAFAYWLFGGMMTAVLVFFSSFAGSAGVVVGGVAGVYFGYSLLGMIPKLGKYLPVKLTDADSLMNGTAAISEYIPAAVIAGVVMTAALAAAGVIFSKRGMG